MTLVSNMATIASSALSANGRYSSGSQTLSLLWGETGLLLHLATGSVVLIAPAAVAFVLALFAVGLIDSTLSGIIIAAVYRYAAEGEAGGFISEELVRQAFRPKLGSQAAGGCQSRAPADPGRGSTV